MYCNSVYTVGGFHHSISNANEVLEIFVFFSKHFTEVIMSWELFDLTEISQLLLSSRISLIWIWRRPFLVIFAVHLTPASLSLYTTKVDGKRLAKCKLRIYGVCVVVPWHIHQLHIYFSLCQTTSSDWFSFGYPVQRTPHPDKISR